MAALARRARAEGATGVFLSWGEDILVILSGGENAFFDGTRCVPATRLSAKLLGHSGSPEARGNPMAALQ